MVWEQTQMPFFFARELSILCPTDRSPIILFLFSSLMFLSCGYFKAFGGGGNSTGIFGRCQYGADALEKSACCCSLHDMVSLGDGIYDAYCCCEVTCVCQCDCDELVVEWGNSYSMGDIDASKTIRQSFISYRASMYQPSLFPKTPSP